MCVCVCVLRVIEWLGSFVLVCVCGSLCLSVCVLGCFRVSVFRDFVVSCVLCLCLVVCLWVREFAGLRVCAFACLWVCGLVGLWSYESVCVGALICFGCCVFVFSGLLCV